MNYVDHIVRNGVLAGTATVALSTGTEKDLYPVANLYNGRPGVPFRSEDVSLVIDVDMGAAISVKEVFLLATNLENIAGNAINLKACGATPPVTDRGNGSPFGLGDVVSDIYSTIFLYPIKWTFSASCRYFRFTIAQANRVAPFTQIGEIWIEPAGDHSWFDDSEIDTLFPARESWSGRSDPVVEHERQARARAFFRGQDAEHRADMAGAATLWERMYRSQPLTAIDEAGYFGQRRSLRLQDFRDVWSASESGESVIKTFAGDGKI